MEARDTLLLACGTSSSRKSFRSIFEDSFNLLEADNSHQARLFLEQNFSCIAAVILDITVPSKIDTRVMKEIEQTSLLKEIPIVIITDEDTPESMVSIFEHGATDVYSASCDPYIIQHRIHNIVELHRHKWHLEELVDEQAATLRRSNDAMVDALSSIIEYRSVESGQHILRIRRFTKILLEEISRSCPEYELTEARIRLISSAAALHDIGKISIPDSILNKPGKLSEEEWEIMKTHSLTGCRILESLHDVGNQEYLRYAHNICHYHHERWDGSGYPEGIAGDDIPICAQVVGLADAYDALTSKRVYKNAFSFEESMNMILNGDCGAFSPKVLECFKQVSGKFEELAQAYADGHSPKTENFDVTLPPPSRQNSQNTLQAVQAKYQTMLHYANATVVEVDLDLGLYHLVYNPDPNLIMLRPSNSFQEIQKSIMEHVLLPEERERFQTILYTEIPKFFRDGYHRQNYQLRVRSRTAGGSELYEVTFLRLDPSDMARRRMIILWKKSGNQAAPIPAAPAVSAPGPETTPYELLVEICCCRNDAYFTLESAGAGLSALTGYTLAEIKSGFQNRLIELVAPQDRQFIRQKFNEQLAYGSSAELTYRLRHKDGHTIWVLHKSQLVLKEDGHEYLYNVLMDITRAKNAQDVYSMTLEQYQLILSQTGNIVFEWDLVADTIIFANTYEEIFGYAPMTRDILANISTHSHIHPDDIPLLFEWFHALQSSTAAQLTEIRIAKADGHYLWCRLRGATTHDANGKPVRILGLIVNIDPEKQATKALQQQAEHDSLTKLLNKQTARKQAEDYLASFPNGAHCALLIIDLDNFKQVNDQYGHMFGDAVLAQVARELKEFFRSQDIVARIGGDEFMVLMRDISDPKLVQKRCNRLISAFSSVFQGQLYDCPLSCSVGVSLSPTHGTSYYDLFQHADQALYQAKNCGKNRCVFYDSKDPTYHTPRKMASVAKTRIDSEEQPGLANDSIVQYAFQHLYGSRDMESAVNDILELMGRQTNVSRVYVFENSPDNKTCSNTFEWCNTGISPEKEFLQGISYETDIPHFEDNFNEQGIFYCSDIEELPQYLYDILEPQGIKSLLHCAIRDNGVFRGYIGFDECRTKRLWTKDQIQTMTFFSEMLGTFLLKERAQAETARRVDDLVSVLDNQNVWIYIIDPDTCELRFLNAKSKAIAPDAKEGMFCYKALMGVDERCPNCPARDIRQIKNHEQAIMNEHLHLYVQSEATLIQWGGEEACLITCREIPQQTPSE